MRTIINARAYDTQTAKHIGDNHEGNGRGDFNFLEESLYQKKTGEFFLAGEGHGFTKYATHFSDGTRSMGKRILPITIEEAQEWVEAHANNLYEDIFGQVEE